MTRRVRFGILATAVFAVFVFIYLSMFRSTEFVQRAQTGQGGQHPAITKAVPASGDRGSAASNSFDLPPSVLTGSAIAPELENVTAKQELGRASWRLLHTMMARFPEKPKNDERLALQTYVQLFARLYPCGDCATHFQRLLDEFPPQTSSRNAAAGWACFVHNEVNKRLEKNQFDCNKIGDFYDCGCGNDDEKSRKSATETGLDGKPNTRSIDTIKLEKEV